MSKQAGFTPGPWEVGTKRPYRVCTLVGPSQTERADFVVSRGLATGGNGWPHGVDYDELRANARLIVSAPDLYAACRASVARMKGVFDDPYLMAMGPLRTDTNEDVLSYLRAAIAKAEETTP